MNLLDAKGRMKRYELANVKSAFKLIFQPAQYAITAR